MAVPLEASHPTARPPRGAADALLLTALLLVVAAAFAGVSPTNFGGYDEWLVVSLTGRGILDMPHANRPLDLLWSMPGALLLPGTFAGYLIAHAAYVVLTGYLVFVLVRRACPAAGVFTAYLAAVLAVSWGPLDYMRLDAPLIARYSGATLAALASALMLVESWERRHRGLLVLAALSGAITARGCEAALPLLLAAPALLLAGRARGRSLAAWAGVWTVAVLGAAALVAAPAILGEQGLYQTEALRFDPHPLRVLGRLARQFGFQLVPLVTTSPRELATPAVPAALAAFGFGCWVAWRGRMDETRVLEPRRLAGLLVVGAVAAALGHAAFVLSAAIVTPARTQVVSAPGMGLLLAAGISLVSLALPARARRPAAALLGSAVVALGTARVAAMQAQWDLRTAYPAQARLLRGLKELAPGLRPHTLVVLLDEPRAFEATFSFRHALAFVYAPEVSGLVWGGHPFLYAARFTREGLLWEPWPEIRGPWRDPVTVFGYDELLVARHRAGAVEVLEAWPSDHLPPLPPGARYEPRARVVVTP